MVLHAGHGGTANEDKLLDPPRSTKAAVLGGHLCALILGTSARAVAMSSIGCAALAIDRAVVVVTAGGCGRVVAPHLGRSLRRRALVLRRDG